ncbi:MAG: hypothetical protein ACRDK8_13610 [Solirubrobacteraceae bacterium]
MVVLVVVVAGAASSAGAIVPGRSGGVRLARCVRAVIGAGAGHRARPVAGSADPTVVSGFAVFRRHRSAADRLPVGADLREQLAVAGARTYDPSAAVALVRTGAHAVVYAVPATVAVPTLPVGCAGLRQLAGVRGYLALRADETGSGKGACLISTQLAPSPPTMPLPGRARPQPPEQLTVAGAACESEAVLSGYVGAFGEGSLGAAHQLALIPDPIASITYALPDGRALTAPVAGNLVTVPAALTGRIAARHLTAAKLKRLLAARLPTTVTETGADGRPVAGLARPASLISDFVRGLSFLRRLYAVGSTTTSSSSTSGTGASCSARTHRCVAVTVTTTCNGDERCHMRRTIERYRYRTAKPPAGTTGPDTQPTGPIVARVNRLITRPTRPVLVLRGAPHHRVVVLLSVTCFARHSDTGVGGPPLKVAVPSRTPISLPGHARAFRACAVGALVVSRGHGPVHATVVRG